MNKEDRPSIKQLLAAEFFAEDTGFKLELLNRDHLVTTQENMIKFRLKVTDQRKLRREKPAHKENEAIEFDFNLESDNCTEVRNVLKISVNSFSRCIDFLFSNVKIS